MLQFNCELIINTGNLYLKIPVWQNKKVGIAGYADY
jgi:hypothetical protein